MKWHNSLPEVERKLEVLEKIKKHYAHLESDHFGPSAFADNIRPLLDTPPHLTVGDLKTGDKDHYLVDKEVFAMERRKHKCTPRTMAMYRVSDGTSIWFDKSTPYEKVEKK